MPLRRLELAPAAQRHIREDWRLQVEGLPRSTREGADLTRAKPFSCSYIVDSSQQMLTGNSCSQSTGGGLSG